MQRDRHVGIDDRCTVSRLGSHRDAQGVVVGVRVVRQHIHHHGCVHDSGGGVLPRLGTS